MNAVDPQAVCRCDVFVVSGSEEKLCAIAQGTIAALPAAPSKDLP